MPTTTGKATDLITFSRGTLATVTDADGKIKWAPHNLLPASEQFDASSWGKYLITVTANSTAAPNGTTTADTIATSSTNATIYQTNGIPIGTTTYSVYLKAGTLTSVKVIFDGGSATGREATFTLSGSGTAGAVANASGGAGTFSGGTSSISALSDGWYLCSIAGVTTTAVGTIVMQLATSGNVIAWGASLTRADLGGMQSNASAYPYYNPSTAKNLIGYSEDFSNAAWSKTNILAFGSGSTANAIAAPNGSLSADLITPNTTSGYHYVMSSSIAIGGGVAIHSVYVKPNGYTKVGLREGATSAYYASFNLVGAGSVLDNTATYATPAIAQLADGWYRISVKFTNATSQKLEVWVLSDSYTSGDVVANWTPNGTSGIYLWGAQVSDSASLDAYVPNFGAAPSAAAAHGPRLDYDPVTLAAKGLLVEEARTNLLQRSQEFDNAYWTKSNATITANAGVAPDGTMTADALISTATLSAKFMSRGSLTSTVGTFSVYAKAAGETVISLWLIGATVGASFTLTGNGSTAFLGSVTGATSSITPVGNGWYRCVYSNTSATTTANIYLRDGSGYTGDGTSGALFWGAQLEAGSFATSYIQNVDSAAGVQRLADVASVGVSQFPYSSSEGTLVWNYSSFGRATAGGRIVSMGVGGSNTYQISPIVVNATQDQIFVTDVSGTAINGTTYTSNQAVNKGGIAYKANDFAVASNGTVAITASSGAVPSQTDQLRLGRAINQDAAFLNGHIRQITYLPRRLSNAEIVARSA